MIPPQTATVRRRSLTSRGRRPPWRPNLHPKSPNRTLRRTRMSGEAEEMMSLKLGMGVRPKLRLRLRRRWKFNFVSEIESGSS
ncbi:unnamed protein product [Prunus armeniaca]|uniref:Uncharacterized protein n=2 Tax=Prunus armeniaca TaxID=36596 RepID=A0A6J5WIE5_PRUAR|nr:unnamed protein product [Prunus armeniaca]